MAITRAQQVKQMLRRRWTYGLSNIKDSESATVPFDKSYDENAGLNNLDR